MPQQPAIFAFCHFLQDPLHGLGYDKFVLRFQPHVLQETHPTQKITTYLWFNNNAEEAINFYTSIFPNSAILNVARYPEGGPGQPGMVMSATFQLEGQTFMALNGGPQFQFTEAISLFVHCQTQAEVDHYWEKLTEGGEEQPCGWLKDKFGLSWQIIPSALMELMGDPNPAKAQAVMQAMLQMRKIEVAELQRAYDAA
ncbi:MAG: VOC family protein [bacterium]|nr:VOC family protein [bacterium]